MAAERAGVFEHHSLPGGVSLLVWNTRKFKTISFRVSFLENLDGRAGHRALAAGLLRRGCSAYPDMMSLSRRLEELYGAGLSIDVNRLGERQNLNVRFRVANDRFVGEDSSALRNGMDLIREILTDPVLEDGGFRKAECEQERTNLIRSIRGLLDDKMAYAHRQLLAAMFTGEPYSLFEWGTEEDALKLDAKQVLEDHFLRLGQAPIEAYAVGDLDADQVKQIGEMLSSLSKRKGIEPVMQEQWVDPRPADLVTEELALAQSKLLIGYRLDTRGMDDREYFALSVYNAVLGSGSSYSKLFREVREERSLAYYAHSSMDRLKGFMLLSAGVAAAKWEEAAAVMREQVGAMKKGDFSDEDITVAKGVILNSLTSLNDSPSQAADFVMAARAVGRSPDVAEVSRRIEAVTRDDLLEVAGRPVEQTTYLLKGTQDDQSEAT